MQNVVKGKKSRRDGKEVLLPKRVSAFLLPLISAKFLEDLRVSSRTHHVPKLSELRELKLSFRNGKSCVHL